MKQIKIIGRKNPECSAGEESNGHFPHWHAFIQRFLFGIQQDPCNQVTAEYKKENDKGSQIIMPGFEAHQKKREMIDHHKQTQHKSAVRTTAA